MSCFGNVLYVVSWTKGKFTRCDACEITARSSCDGEHWKLFWGHVLPHAKTFELSDCSLDPKIIIRADEEAFQFVITLQDNIIVTFKIFNVGRHIPELLPSKLCGRCLYLLYR